MWQACLRVALGQYGLITLDQALAAGCSADCFRYHVAKGDLERMAPGVFRLAGSVDSPRQRLKAASLWGGEGTAASHTSAAALVGLEGFTLGDLHAVTTKYARRMPGWANLHRLPGARPGTKRIAGIPVTPPWITLIDLGSVAPEEEVRRALFQALRMGIVSIPQLQWALATFGRPNHRGTKLLAALVKDIDPKQAPPESELEDRFYSLIERSDLPKGQRQHPLWDGEQWRRLDWAVVEISLGVEVDGKKTHGTDEAFDDDRKRDRCVQILGWHVLRFTWTDVTRKAKRTLADIRAMVAYLMSRPELRAKNGQ